MKPREYCCCAVPIVNVGIYATLTTYFIISFLIGIISVATPRIVGAATPSFAALVLAVICFFVSGVQVLGFLGVAREKPILYRRYVTLQGLATTAAFSVGAAWTLISAIRHTTAKVRCLDTFFPSNNSTTSEGDVLCEVFPWVDVGIMGGLWVILAIVNVYLHIILSSYGASQRQDHEKYDQLNNDNIPMNKRNDPWDARPSTDNLEFSGAEAYGHHRQESASEILAQPHLQLREV